MGGPVDKFRARTKAHSTAPHHALTDHSYVTRRRRRDAALAGVARCAAKTIPALGRQQVDLSGNVAARAGRDVRTTHRHHRPEFPFFCAPPGRGRRCRGHNRHRADAARFRAGNCSGNCGPSCNSILWSSIRAFTKPTAGSIDLRPDFSIAGEN